MVGGYILALKPYISTAPFASLTVFGQLLAISYWSSLPLVHERLLNINKINQS